MHGWLWCLEHNAARRDRLGATLILATFGFLLGAWIALGNVHILEHDTDVHDEAASVASAIRDLAGEHRGCADALARLPAVLPAARLRADPWGNPWSIRCHGDLAVVRSAGADGHFGAQDDIVEVALVPTQNDH
jgi:hypothetical protein